MLFVMKCFTWNEKKVDKSTSYHLKSTNCKCGDCVKKDENNGFAKN